MLTNWSDSSLSSQTRWSRISKRSCTAVFDSSASCPHTCPQANGWKWGQRALVELKRGETRGGRVSFCQRWFCIEYGVRFAAPLTTLLSWSPDAVLLCDARFLSGNVCVLEVWGWQDPDVDCLLLNFKQCFSLALLVASPWSFAYHHHPVCLNWRARIDLYLSKGYRRESHTRLRHL